MEILPGFADKSVDHVITDPPYSEHVHGKQRQGSSLPDAKGDGYRNRVSKKACANRKTELGFDALTSKQACAVAEESSRLALRWSLRFCDAESISVWMDADRLAGLDHVRVGAWVRVNGTPQFTGDRPASGFEAVVIAHPRGRKKWNGGGLPAVWRHTVVRPSITNDDRVHTTQKPLELMLELVELFTDPEDLVLDPFAGSGTTGVACLRLGRRFIGIEKDPKYAAIARERLEAESRGLTLKDVRHGQTSIFDAMESK